MSGTVKHDMKPAFVYKMRAEFMKWPKERFVANLATLKKQIARDYGRMLTDLEHYRHDLEVLKNLQRGEEPGPIPWHKSDAKKLLNAEIDNGVLEQVSKPTPLEIYNSKVEYRAFGLKKFRNHIYQEVKRREKVESRLRFGKKKYRNPQDTIKDNLKELVEAHKGMPPKKKKKADSAPKPPIEEIVSRNAYAKPAETKQQRTACRRSSYGRTPAVLRNKKMTNY